MNIEKAMRLTAKYRAATVSDEDRDKAYSKAVDYILMGYTMMNTVDIILRETEKIMASIGVSRAYTDPLKINDSRKDLERIIKRNDIVLQRIDGLITEVDPKDYDRMRNNAYEILRFVMLFYSRTCGNLKATNQLEAYMKRMKSNGIFSDEEMSKFKMK